MSFVFYDTETTGINPDFDQMLQIAAILTTDDFKELDRFETRCRLLPWIVPSPVALKLTGLSPTQIADTAIPSHYEAMRSVRKVLDTWSPATFVGYNSISFDEEFLRRGFWQTLQSPWLTVTNGNTRLDLLPIVQTASLFAPHALRWPTDDQGRRRFNLDRLAPKNGFAHANAHDAMGDTEATLHIARMLAMKAPDLWKVTVSRSVRRNVKAILESGEPILCIESPNQIAWSFRCVLGNNPRSSSAMLAARLDIYWEIVSRGSNSDLRALLSQPDRPVRSLPANRAPMVFSRGEAGKLWGINSSVFAQRQFHFLSTNPKFVHRLIDLWVETHSARNPAVSHLEQSFYHRFPDRFDQQIAESFHEKEWASRMELLQSLNDDRLRRWGQRLIYAEAPSSLPMVDRHRLEAAIAARLLADVDDQRLWRTISEARRELTTLEEGDQFAKNFEEFLNQAEMRFRNVASSGSDQHQVSQSE